MKTKKELKECAERLLKSEKPKIIVGDFVDEKDLTKEQMVHFKTAEYLWQLTPQTQGKCKGKYMGLLLDESLDYVHIVFVSANLIIFLADLNYSKLQ